MSEVYSWSRSRFLEAQDHIWVLSYTALACQEQCCTLRQNVASSASPNHAGSLLTKPELAKSSIEISRISMRLQPGMLVCSLSSTAAYGTDPAMNTTHNVSRQNMA